MVTELLMEISKDEHEHARNRSRRMAEHDRYSDIATAEERGEIRGEIRGVIRGKIEGMTEILDLIKQGVSTDEILRKFSHQ